MSSLRYLFLDMNSFFASVEQQERPALRGRPVAVVPTLTPTTCCIAASAQAKARGVRTGTGVAEACRMCPGLQLVEARPGLYVRYHHRIVRAVESCLHVEQVCSIDEMWGRLYANERSEQAAVALARRVKQAIARTVGPCLRCSVGLGPNVWLAKVATELQKPDGLVALHAEQLPGPLTSLALTDLPGINHRMARRLHQHGVDSVAGLYRLDVEQLSRIWASRVMGEIWWHQLHGHQLPRHPTTRRSVGHSHVLPPDLRHPDRAYAVMARMIHKAAARLRRLGYWAGRMILEVRFTDGARWQSRIPLGLARDTLTMVQALRRAWPRPMHGKPMKVAVTLVDLVSEAAAGQPLFAEQARRDRLARAMDAIDRRFGRQAVYLACMFGHHHTAPTRISFTSIPDLDQFDT